MREKTKLKIGEFSQMMQVTVKTYRQKKKTKISLLLRSNKYSNQE